MNSSGSVGISQAAPEKPSPSLASEVCETSDVSLNRENIKRVRDHIASLPAEQFDMRTWNDQHPCGTVACIGGWAERLLLGTTDGLPATVGAVEEALGISFAEADALFHPPLYWRRGLYTQAHAVATLDHLIATGKVDWDAAKVEPEGSSQHLSSDGEAGSEAQASRAAAEQSSPHPHKGASS